MKPKGTVSIAVVPGTASSITSEHRFKMGFFFIIIIFSAFFAPRGPILQTKISKLDSFNKETKEHNNNNSFESILEAESEKPGSRHTGITSARICPDPNNIQGKQTLAQHNLACNLLIDRHNRLCNDQQIEQFHGPLIGLDTADLYMRAKTSYIITGIFSSSLRNKIEPKDVAVTCIMNQLTSFHLASSSYHLPSISSHLF